MSRSIGVLSLPSTSIGARMRGLAQPASCRYHLALQEGAEEPPMGADWINLLVLVAILAIVGGAIAIFRLATTRPAGRKVRGLAQPSKTARRKVNPKTGDLFP